MENKVIKNRGELYIGDDSMTQKVIHMEDGGTLIVSNSPSKQACEDFIKVILEMKNKKK
jgi:hypothetical protein